MHYLSTRTHQSYKDFGEGSVNNQWFVNLYQYFTILGLDPVSSGPPGATPNELATQCHVNWGVVYHGTCYKIMDPVSTSLPLNL